MYNNNITRDKLSELNTRLRIMILQNARVEEEYDDLFLLEVNHITQQILDLKKEHIRVNRVKHDYSSRYATKY